MTLARRCAILLLAALATAAPAQASPLRLSQTLTPHPAQDRAPVVANPGLRLRSSTEVRESIIRQLVLLKGEALIGMDYQLGADGDGDQAIDCSALVQRMYETAGVEVPRTTQEQITVGRAVAQDDLEPGDLLFYRWGRRGLHVAVYLDEGLILHASTSAREVVVSALNGAWQRRLVAARRLI